MSKRDKDLVTFQIEHGVTQVRGAHEIETDEAFCALKMLESQMQKPTLESILSTDDYLKQIEFRIERYEILLKEVTDLAKPEFQGIVKGLSQARFIMKESALCKNTEHKPE